MPFSNASDERGSGIGLTLSADLADAVFMHVMGKRSLFKEIFRDSFGIQFYGRHMDDILMIVEQRPTDHPRSVVPLMRLLRKLCSSTYSLKVEEVRNSLSLLGVWSWSPMGITQKGQHLESCAVSR